MPLALALLIASILLAWPAAAAAAWTWPVEGPVLSPFSHDGSRYGAGFHRGIDIEARPGTPVAAATDGLVTFVGRAADSGLTVGLRTADGRFDTAYLHLEAATVEKGQEVEAGSVLGRAGVSGRPSSGVPHLHFGVRDAGTASAYRDPLDFLGGDIPAPPAGGPLATRPPKVAGPLPRRDRRRVHVPRARPHAARRLHPGPASSDPVPADRPLPAGRLVAREDPAGARSPAPAVQPDQASRRLRGSGGDPLHLPANAPLGPGAEDARGTLVSRQFRRDGGSPEEHPAGHTGPGRARLIGAAAAFVLILVLFTGARGQRLSSIARRWATTSQRRSTT